MADVMGNVPMMHCFVRGEAYVLPDQRPGQYQFTIDFTGSDLADFPDQHKHLHIVKMGCGLIGAFPNNRVLMPDPAFWPMMDIAAHRPDFASLSGEYRAEGNQHLFRVETAPQPRVADDLPTTH